MTFLRDMLASTGRTIVTRNVGLMLGLTALWVGLALARDGTTFHLAPVIVAGALPVLAVFESDSAVSTATLIRLGTVGTVVAAAITLVLAVAGALSGPSLLPFGGAALESIIFGLTGGVGGITYGAVRR